MTVPDGSDPWAGLRHFTAARIGLARNGASLATQPLLERRRAEAEARDAVAAELDLAALEAGTGPFVAVHSAARDRAEYRLRPDLGRQLAPGTALQAGDYELALVLADGLSATAVQAHAPAVLLALRRHLAGWRLAPLVVVQGGRVAVGDAVARAQGAGAVLVLIGERPGLSAPDSLGAYITWRPRPGVTDADRNCVSNIRPAGLPPVEAAARIAWLLATMRSSGRSGVMLKDGSDGQAGTLDSTPPPALPDRGL